MKAVHLEAVSDLTSAAFIAALCRFIARRGYPTLIWSDNGTNFVGANSELKELHTFLSQQKTVTAVSEFCTSHRIRTGAYSTFRWTLGSGREEYQEAS